MAHRQSPLGATSKRDLITVIVGRFDPVIALGLEAVLRDDRWVDVIASGLSHSALISAAARWAPRVLILNETAERVARSRLDSIPAATGMLVFAHEPASKYGMMLLAAGTTCVARSAPPADILDAVRLVARGGRTFRAGGQPTEGSYPEHLPPLTRRETEVLKRLSEGKPHKQTARELQIGIRTVHTYASQVCRKLGVQSKRELVGMPIPSPGTTRA